MPASILKRLPVRFTYDDNYFSHPVSAELPRKLRLERGELSLKLVIESWQIVDVAPSADDSLFPVFD